ncbi:MAG: SIMPL domain-containing protein [Acidobacteriota bacterium]
MRWMPCLVLVVAAAASAQTIQVDKNNRTIAVTASDKASAEADTAVVSVGFQIYAPDAATAYSQGSQISNAILGALKKAGVPDKAIESREQNLGKTDFPFNPQPAPEERVKKAFNLSQSWAVHTSAADAAKILHVAIEAGANQSGNIEWDVTDRKGLQAQAAQKALVNAHAIAAQMASGLGVSLGSLIYASNQAPMAPGRPRVMNFMAAKAAPPPAPLAIRPQQVEESATVYAVFAIE